jgi:catechol 2,3-dioxygenase-like lactoylglutathione lyase family enzyme
VHIVLAVTDVDRSRAFYEQAFGWKPHLSWPETYSELALPGEDRIGLYRRDGFAASAGAGPLEVAEGRQTGTELYVRVDDLETAMERLRKAGARRLSGLAVREWGDEAAYFADPDGNVVAVARRLPGS